MNRVLESLATLEGEPAPATCQSCVPVAQRPDQEAIAPLRKLALSQAHRLLSRLIDMGAIPPGGPVTASAMCEDAEVFITIGSPLARIDALGKPKLTPLQQRIAAVLQGQPARKAAWVAAKLGKKNVGGGFRHSLAEMVRFGVLVKGPDGRGYQIPAYGQRQAIEAPQTPSPAER